MRKIREKSKLEKKKRAPVLWLGDSVIGWASGWQSLESKLRVLGLIPRASNMRDFKQAAM